MIAANKNSRNRILLAAVAAVAASLTSASARAEQLVYWDFNAGNASPTTFNSHFLSTPSLSLAGGTTATFAGASGSSDPIAGLGYNTTTYPAITSGNKTAGLQINLNTSNFDVSTLQFDLRTSNSSSRWMQMQYTLNGSTWIDTASFSSAGGDTWNNQITMDLTGVAGADNNPNFAIRIVSMFSPDAFTQTTSPFTSYGPNQAYRAAHTDDRAYGGGTWRFDTVSLEGIYTGGAFSATNLSWNSGSGNWDTNPNNKPWLNPSNQPTAFTQAGGQGDNVTFNNPAANSVITVQGAGVTPNSTAITNNATLTFNGGTIGGTGGLIKNGTGRLILASSNSFTSAQNPTQVNAGVVETRANNALGSGTISIGNATWNSTTAAQTSAGVTDLTGNVTFQTDASLTIDGGFSGSGVITKTGSATLGVGGISSNVGTMNVQAGTVRMDNMGALGGNALFGTPAGTLGVTNSTIIAFATGNNGIARTRLSSDIVMTNGTLRRAQLTPAISASPTNGDSEFSSYTVGTTTFVGGTFSVDGSATLANDDTRTAATSDLPGGGGSNNMLIVRMPVLVTTGSTLAMFSANGTLSTVGGELTGTIGNTAVALRGVPTDVNANDSLTLKSGATLLMSGPGEKRIGSSDTGKPIVGFGNSATEATIKADGRTYMTDISDPGTLPSIFVVSGSGTGGLRVEAPMNANYSAELAVFSTCGLFGNNPDGSSTEGSTYTIMSPSRYAGMSDGGPTTGVDGTPITRGGTLTLAAIDPAGATGIIDNGPANGTAVKLGLDNTSASGALTYLINSTANAARFSNLGGLVLKKTGAASVTTRLLADTTLNGASAANTSLELLSGTLDLNLHRLTVGVGSLTSGAISGGGTVSANSIAKISSGIVSVGPGVRLDTPSLQATGGVLKIVQDGTSASTSKVGAISIGPSAKVDLVDNDLVVGSGTSKAQVQAYIVSARNGGNFNGTTGLTSSAADSHPSQSTTLGLLSGAEYSSVGGSGVFSGQSYSASDNLVKYTWYGDTDFNGKVDGADYARVDATFNNEASQGNIGGWLNGDFDYNNKVDGADYALIDSAFNAQSGTLRPMIDFLNSDRTDRSVMNTASLRKVLNHLDEFGESYATALLQSVPEPSLASTALVGVACCTLRRRVRRTRLRSSRII